MNQDQARERLESLRRQRKDAEEKRSRHLAAADVASARYQEAMGKLKEYGVESVEEGRTLLQKLNQELQSKINEIQFRMETLQ